MSTSVFLILLIQLFSWILLVSYPEDWQAFHLRLLLLFSLGYLIFIYRKLLPASVIVPLVAIHLVEFICFTQIIIFDFELQAFVIYYTLLLFIFCLSFKDRSNEISIIKIEKSDQLLLAISILSIIITPLAYSSFTYFKLTDTITATWTAVENLINFNNPYSNPELEEGWHNTAIHQQNYMYPPGMLALYLPLHGPFILLGEKFKLLGIYFSNIFLTLISIRLFYLILRNWLLNNKLILVSTLLFASSPLLLFEGVCRATNDLAPICLTLAGIYFLSKERKLIAYLFLFWATYTKWYPGIFVVYLAFKDFHQKNYQTLIKGMLIGVGLTLVLFLPFFYDDADALISDLSWQAKRPIQDWELGLNPEIWIFILSAILCWKVFFRTIYEQSHNLLVPIITIFLFVLLNRVYHTNYLLWLLPLIFLLPDYLRLNSPLLLNGVSYVRIGLLIFGVIGLGLFNYFIVYFPTPRVISSETFNDQIVIEYYNPWAKSVYLRWWSDNMLQPIEFPGDAPIFNAKTDFAVRSLMTPLQGSRFRIQLPISSDRHIINYEFWYSFTKEVDRQKLLRSPTKLVPKEFPQQIFNLSDDFIFDNNSHLYWRHVVD